MKKILLILSVILLAACGKDPLPDEPDMFWNPDAMVTIREAPTKDLIPGLSAMEIVENGINIKYTSHYANSVYMEQPRYMFRTFGEGQKDFDIPALLMFGTDIIAHDYDENNNPYTYLYRDFIYAYDVYITNWDNDTIACIPDEVLVNARTLIEEAYNNNDYEEVYRLFDEAFTFVPIEPKK